MRTLAIIATVYLLLMLTLTITAYTSIAPTFK
jgi:hypothetical protein